METFTNKCIGNFLRIYEKNQLTKQIVRLKIGTKVSKEYIIKHV